METDKYLQVVDIKPDAASHINLRGRKKCLGCKLKPCIYVCPSGVFSWNNEQSLLEIAWQRCIECGACEPGCPPGNIDLKYPRGGYGVKLYV